MKKILATILTITMLASLAVVFCVPAAAIDGEWIVYSKADHEMDDFDGDPMSIPGYEYTDEGLKVIPADWKDFSPGAGVRRKELSDITEGVYMQVRIDAFSYGADGWFNFNIYSQSKMKPGKTDVEKWGYGVQTLIRYQEASDTFGISWYTGGFANTGSSKIPADKVVRDEDGRLIFTFAVEFDGNNFAVTINGVDAPAEVITYMNELYTKEEAYVGFNLQNSVKGGDCACTVLSYGTSEANAAEPVGEDRRDPINNYIEVSAIADPSTVEAGKPAVFLNANKNESDSKKLPVSAGSIITVNTEDYSSHVVASKSTASVTYETKNSVSYDIDDFSTAIILVKNFCTCSDEAECWAVESIDMYLMTGEIISADGNHKVKELPMSEEVIVINGERYLYFYYDMDNCSWDAEGRINGARFDFNQIDVATPGKNAFDVIYSAFFRSEDEAISYTEDYLKNLGWDGEYGMPDADAGDDEGDNGNDETVGGDAGDETVVGDNDVTETPNDGNTTTEAPNAGNTTTEAPTNNNTNTSNGGCGSVVGFGAVALITLAAGAGFVSFKKKD